MLSWTSCVAENEVTGFMRGNGYEFPSARTSVKGYELT